MKINQDVYRKCLQLLEKIRENPDWKSLDQQGSQYPEFKSQMDMMTQIENNTREYKYAATSQLSSDLRKMFRDLKKSSTVD